MFLYTDTHRHFGIIGAAKRKDSSKLKIINQALSFYQQKIKQNSIETKSLGKEKNDGIKGHSPKAFRYKILFFKRYFKSQKLVSLGPDEVSGNRDISLGERHQQLRCVWRKKEGTCNADRS